MNAQERANRRLGILTLLSAIFMPLTFMAGIWGMNFEGMPELKVPLAYPSVLGIMIIDRIGYVPLFSEKRLVRLAEWRRA